MYAALDEGRKSVRDVQAMDMGAKRALPLLASVEELAVTVAEILDLREKDRALLQKITERSDNVRQYFGIARRLLDKTMKEKADEQGMYSK